MLHQIGSGVLGPVFRSFDPQRDRIVAVKAFKLDLLPEDVARVTASLRRLVAMGFTHPHHVAVLDAGLEGTTPFLVSEYVSGETLDVARRQLSNMQAAATLPWLRQVASAIDAAHEVGLRHGALHPRDVMIAGRTGEARVTGFGVAGVLETVGARLPVRRPYTAPERTSGDPWDVRADVYSLAAIAHELLTGRRPAGPGEQDGALGGGLTPEQRVAVRKVLATGLAERPEMRFESAAALVHALDVAVTGGQPELPLAVPVPAETEPSPPTNEIAADSAAVMDAQTETADAAVSDAVHSTDDEVGDDTPLPAAVLAVEAPAAAPDTIHLSPPPSAFRGHEPLSIFQRPEPPALAIPPEATRYPLVAIAAVGLAGLIVGGALGYRAAVGRSTTPSPSPGAPAATVPAPGPADTEVAVTREPAPPPARSETAPPAAIEPRAERAVAPTGQVTVQSDPNGALVTVDGRFRGETPITIRDLSLGAHAIQIARPGHVPWSERLTLTASSPARVVSAVLRPGVELSDRASGSIYIDSRPRGARVMIDGRFVGTTPFRISGMAAGRHDVRIELDGYRAASMPVTVTSTREARVAVTLELGGALPGGRGPVR